MSQDSRQAMTNTGKPGAIRKIATGQLRIRDPETGEFRLAEPDRAASATKLIRCQDEAGSGG